MEITITLTTPASYPPPEPDAWQRLRKLLKALLRVYGLRCVDIRRTDEDKP
ncbi:MAG: hypothetical protein MUC43_00105 [Pirellula sp.]|jgi:hypothetical protein|nr:hypothetical protein [Pirellula sp.]